MGAFEYRQAEEIRDVFGRLGVRDLFIGKSGAVILGDPVTTQDADLFPERNPENGRALVAGLRELGFDLTDSQAAEIERGKGFVQLKNGLFDLDLIFAPDGIERFSDGPSAQKIRGLARPRSPMVPESKTSRPNCGTPGACFIRAQRALWTLHFWISPFLGVPC
jgi:hypothetical protein